MKSTEEKVSQLTAHTFGTWNRQKAWKTPMLVTDAEGVYIYDDKGKPYLDFSSQLICSNLGHKNKTVIEAIVRQAEKLPYVAPAFVTEAAMEAVEAIRSVLPQTLGKFFFSTSGTEANEAALKMARQSQFPAYKAISRYRSFHGSTPSSAALTGDPRRWPSEQARCTIEGVRFAPDCYCYRCPFDLEYPACNVQCARYLDYMIKEEGNVAAIVVEPIVGTNGRLVPPPEYFPLVREICDKHGVLLIFDEIMTGWFRTGPAFAMEHWNVTPDILTMAKGASASYTPVGITAASDKVAGFFEEEFFCHGHTYAYHPLASSAIPAAVSEYKRVMASGLPQKASKHLQAKLYELADKHECVGDVRGIGHFWALEIVKNRKTREPFNVKEDKISGKPLMTAKIAAEALKQGMFMFAWYDNLIIAPPLIVTEEEIDKAKDILDQALKVADSEVESTGVPASRTTEYASN
ncbi:MAG: aminotransferase class III-fold pyridoxal phosphate-dependent enzyme [Desulfohalobiaceae bacterium]|nr:aminotransferase class III-fold pyridoxal phosphate-dependent enzyme [Desulfohalobiaceae bacterium]